MSKINYEIIEKISVLSQRGKWSKELNRVSWNGREPKYDLRDWNHEDEKIGKGVTLSDEEAKLLLEALQGKL